MNGSNATSAGDLPSFLRIAAAERPSQPAYIFGSDAIPFKELHEDSDICARGLAIRINATPATFRPDTMITASDRNAALFGRLR